MIAISSSLQNVPQSDQEKFEQWGMQFSRLPPEERRDFMQQLNKLLEDLKQNDFRVAVRGAVNSSFRLLMPGNTKSAFNEVLSLFEGEELQGKHFKQLLLKLQALSGKVQMSLIEEERRKTHYVELLPAEIEYYQLPLPNSDPIRPASPSSHDEEDSEEEGDYVNVSPANKEESFEFNVTPAKAAQAPEQSAEDFVDVAAFSASQGDDAAAPAAEMEVEVQPETPIKLHEALQLAEDDLAYLLGALKLDGEAAAEVVELALNEGLVPLYIDLEKLLTAVKANPSDVRVVQWNSRPHVTRDQLMEMKLLVGQAMAPLADFAAVARLNFDDFNTHFVDKERLAIRRLVGGKLVRIEWKQLFALEELLVDVEVLVKRFNLPTEEVVRIAARQNVVPLHRGDAAFFLQKELESIDMAAFEPKDVVTFGDMLKELGVGGEDVAYLQTHGLLPSLETTVEVTTRDAAILSTLLEELLHGEEVLAALQQLLAMDLEEIREILISVAHQMVTIKGRVLLTPVATAALLEAIELTVESLGVAVTTEEELVAHCQNMSIVYRAKEPVVRSHAELLQWLAIREEDAAYLSSIDLFPALQSAQTFSEEDSNLLKALLEGVLCPLEVVQMVLKLCSMTMEELAEVMDQLHHSLVEWKGGQTVTAVAVNRFISECELELDLVPTTVSEELKLKCMALAPSVKTVPVAEFSPTAQTATIEVAATEVASPVKPIETPKPEASVAVKSPATSEDGLEDYEIVK